MEGRHVSIENVWNRKKIRRKMDNNTRPKGETKTEEIGNELILIQYIIAVFQDTPKAYHLKNIVKSGKIESNTALHKCLFDENPFKI